MRTTSRLKPDGLHSGDSHWLGYSRERGGSAGRAILAARLRSSPPAATRTRVRVPSVNKKSTEYAMQFDP